MLSIIRTFPKMSIGNVNYFKNIYPQVIHRQIAPIISHSIAGVKRFFNFFAIFHFIKSSQRCITLFSTLFPQYSPNPAKTAAL